MGWFGYYSVAKSRADVGAVLGRILGLLGLVLIGCLFEAFAKEAKGDFRNFWMVFWSSHKHL